MKKNSIFKTAVAVIVLTACLAVVFGACTSVSKEDAYQILKAAAAESFESPVYFWEEYKKDEGNDSGIQKRNEYCLVQVLNDKNANGDLIANQISARVLQKKDDKVIYEAYCGLSSGKGKNSAQKSYLFEETKDGKTKTAMAAAEFVANYVNGNGYSLQEILAEIMTFTAGQSAPAWAEIEKAAKQGELTEVSVRLKREEEGFKTYLQEFERDNGYPSVFADAEKLSFEIVYGRISNMICHRNQPIKGTSINVEISIYELYINYFGPNLLKQTPSYDDGAWKESANIGFIPKV